VTPVSQLIPMEAGSRRPVAGSAARSVRVIRAAPPTSSVAGGAPTGADQPIGRVSAVIGTSISRGPAAGDVFASAAASSAPQEIRSAGSP
jgi:hypothetical protein